MPDNKYEKRADELLSAALVTEYRANSGLLDQSDRDFQARYTLQRLGYVRPDKSEEVRPAVEKFLVDKGFKSVGAAITDDVLLKLADFYKKAADLADDKKANNSLSDNYDRLEVARGKYSSTFNNIDPQMNAEKFAPVVAPTPGAKI
ncbi:MAG: hypothetical protein ACT4OY_07270 [Alphaproteobacteria bacterium]